MPENHEKNEILHGSHFWRDTTNSRPRSIYGQQYPCPAFLFFPDFPIVSRAAAPEGQCPVEYRGYFVRPYVRPSVCPSVHLLF